MWWWSVWKIHKVIVYHQWIPIEEFLWLYLLLFTFQLIPSGATTSFYSFTQVVDRFLTQPCVFMAHSLAAAWKVIGLSWTSWKSNPDLFYEWWVPFLKICTQVRLHLLKKYIQVEAKNINSNIYMSIKNGIKQCKY